MYSSFDYQKSESPYRLQVLDANVIFVEGIPGYKNCCIFFNKISSNGSKGELINIFDKVRVA